MSNYRIDDNGTVRDMTEEEIEQFQTVEFA